MLNVLRSRAETLDRVVTVFLFLFVLVQPLSIAATHIAYAGAALFWVIRLVLVRRAGLRSSPLDLPILLYWLLCALSSSLSPAPGLSWGRMRAVGLVFLVLVVAHNVPHLRRAKQLVAVLLFSGLLTVAYTAWQYLAGIGLYVRQISPASAFYQAGLRHNDFILRVDAQRIVQPQSFLSHLRAKPATQPLSLLVVHGEGDRVALALPAGAWPQPADLRALQTHLQLEPARPFRATAFYSHYVTYAEVLQLLAALAFGLFLAYRRKLSFPGIALAAIWLAFVAALAATLTRATWLAAAFACLLLLWFHTRRRWLRLALPLVLLLAALGTEAAMRHWRGLGLIDLRDASTDYRLLMWRDGLRLIHAHPWFGVGMDIIRVYWWEFDLAAYQKYRYRLHFHSTPIQIAVERGLPALAAWVLLMAVYWWTLVRLTRLTRTLAQADWASYGLALGSLGGTSGFLASSLVHYNFGDSEVVLLFWFLAGLALACQRRANTPRARRVPAE